MRLICGLAFVLAPLVLSAAPTPVCVLSEYDSIPAYFEQNSGRAGARSLFTAHGAGYSLALERSGATLSLTGASRPARVSLELIKGDRRTTVSGEEPSQGQNNYYIGNQREYRVS
jgi:hypothetical protein